LDLQWPIFTGGRIDALARAAAAERAATAADREAARADLRLEITRAFWALVTARDAERVVQRSLESLQAHVADLRSREAQGLIPPNDVLTAEALVSRRRVLVIESSNGARVAEADLGRLLGREGGERLEPMEALEPPPAGAGVPEVRRPERLALVERVAAAEARESAAAAAARPQVGVAGGYDIARPNPRIFPRSDEWHPSWDVSVNVAWTLWDGGRRRADEAEAAAAARAVSARITEFDRQVRFEITQRQLEFEASLAAIEAATDGIRAATEARRVVGERFAAGVATSTDVLDAEVAVLEAELDRTRALANARLAAARYARAVGSP
jgi:outer membrane protein